MGRQSRQSIFPRLARKPTLLLAVPLALLAGTVLAAAPQVVGIAAAIVKDVRIKGSGAPQFSKAAIRQRVAIADQVQTGQASRLQLQLLDKSIFSIGANARLTIDKFVYDPKGGSLSATVAKGAFRFISGKTGGRKDATIKAPAATIGIRGTILDIVAGQQAVAIARNESGIPRDTASDAETATLVVLRGPGQRTQGKATAGLISVTGASRTVNLDRPLLAAYVPRAGAEPIGPFTISLAGVAWLDGLILLPLDRRLDPGATAQPVPRRREPTRQPYPQGYAGDAGGDPGGVPYGYGIPDLPSQPAGSTVPGRTVTPTPPPPSTPPSMPTPPPATTTAPTRTPPPPAGTSSVPSLPPPGAATTPSAPTSSISTARSVPPATTSSAPAASAAPSGATVLTRTPRAPAAAPVLSRPPVSSPPSGTTTTSKLP